MKSIGSVRGLNYSCTMGGTGIKLLCLCFLFLYLPVLYFIRCILNQNLYSLDSDQVFNTRKKNLQKSNAIQHHHLLFFSPSKHCHLSLELKINLTFAYRVLYMSIFFFCTIVNIIIFLEVICIPLFSYNTNCKTCILKTVPEKLFKCDIDSNCCFWTTLSKEKTCSDFRSDDRECCSPSLFG